MAEGASPPKGDGRGKVPPPPPIGPPKRPLVRAGPRVVEPAARKEALSLADALQQRPKLRVVAAADQRISEIQSIDEPMDQICFSHDFELERAENCLNALYQGGHFGAGMREALEVRNIRTVLSILDESCPSVEEFPGVEYWRSPPVDDLTGRRCADQLEAILDEAHARIDGALSNGASVLVHCRMGVSRSGAVVVAYVMRRLGLGREEALRRVRQCRRVANPNQGFWAMLGRLEDERL